MLHPVRNLALSALLIFVCGDQIDTLADEVKNKQPTMEARIAKALKTTARFDFQQTPIELVASALSREHKIPILIDRTALDDVGLSLDTPVTLQVDDIRLSSALNLALKPLELTWDIRDEAVMITTPEEAETYLHPRVYPVADLVAISNPFLLPASDYDTLIEMISCQVKPDTWSEGNNLDIAALPHLGVVVISQNREAHEEIDQLLSNLRAARQEERAREKTVAESQKDKLIVRMYSVTMAFPRLNIDEKANVDAISKILEIRQKETEGKCRSSS